MTDFLLEIGCEEIPARMIDPARRELEQRVSQLLEREGLAQAATLQSFSTPRRLAVLASNISAVQADSSEQITGPSIKAAFKDGEPTVAARKFAEKVALPLEKLDRISTHKGEYLSAQVHRKGRSASDILADVLPDELSRLYWAKSMYWRPGRTAERFVRPVRWLVAVLDGTRVPLQIFGIEADGASRGHRTLGGAVSIQTPAEYEGKLAAASVLVNPAAREAAIRKALDAATRRIAGACWREDATLLNKVVNLTELPSVILGNFDAQFLSLPEEVLVTVMRDHQNYFAVENSSGALAPHFLAVLNTAGDPRGIIQHGHERVLRARFNDARFFWDTDQKIPLIDRVEMLRVVTFQKDLGSYYEKAERVASLASKLARDLKAAGLHIDAGALEQAARLCKTDLTAELVKEFTELQGVIGGLYARHQGLGQKVADAIYDHYRPESMDDAVPRTLEAAVLSIADKADSIAGMFALGLVPSGSKDPFALRRQANGIVRTVAEKGLSVSLATLLGDAIGGYSGSPAESTFKEKNLATADVGAEIRRLLGRTASGSGSPLVTAITAFLRERLEFYLREARGFAYDVVNAVLAAGADDVLDALARAEAVAQVRGSEDFQSIALAFKRINNIMRQAREAGYPIAAQIGSDLLAEQAERELYESMVLVAPQVRALSGQRNYAGALASIAAMRAHVDAFFDSVMVMAEDVRLRANRLALLQTLLDEFSTIADFSEIVAESK